MKLSERFTAAWNVFRDRTVADDFPPITGPGYYQSASPTSPRLSRGENSRSIVNAIYTKIANDAAAIHFHHVRQDENGNFMSTIDSPLEKALSTSSNLDQSPKAFFLDIFLSLMDEGSIAIVPTDTNKNPKLTDGYEIYSMRVGKVLAWYPSSVRIRLYDERDGQKHEIIVPKSNCALIENPFYSIMNEGNSMLRRLLRKLNKLDQLDASIGSDKLDLIIQLPYAVRTTQQEARAQMRRKSIEDQLAGSKYGIAYIDSSEKVTQLNRAVENDLMSQIQYLTDQFYTQIGVSPDILNGTASESAMLNYYSRVVAVYAEAICQEFTRKFLSETARAQGQAVMFFRDPFELVPVSQIADIADKFTRNEILSSNEMRSIIGYRPIDDPRADELRNKNLNQSAQMEAGEIEPVTTRNSTKGDEGA